MLFTPVSKRIVQSLAQLAACTLLCTTVIAQAQKPGAPPPGAMFSGGRVTLHSADLDLELLTYSGTAARLSPTADTTWDYTPGDKLKERSADTFYHLGDLDIELRPAGTQTWTPLSTAFHRAPAKVLATSATQFITDVTNSLPANSPISLTRTWAVNHNELTLHYTLTNTSRAPLHLGTIGIPMVFNNIMNGRELEEAYSKCSFYDPYIGEDAGYVQVVPLKGTGPVLLVLPDTNTPLEAWKPILDKRSKETHLGMEGNDPTPRGTTFEGSFDWMVHSAAPAEAEWKSAEEWNPPTSETLAPGQSTTYGLRFVIAPSLRQIEPTLTAHSRPVAIGIPGYVLPQDTNTRLFLRYNKPVKTITAAPANAISIHDDGKLPNNLHAYTLRGQQWGRSRLKITYSDGLTQTIAYRTIKPEREAVSDLGHFLFRQQWFTDANDPFHRAPSIISYDDETGRQLTQEPRAWIAGLSDEAGAGSWLAAAMKEELAPAQEEVAKLEEFVDGVLWGGLQVKDGEHAYGVHKSMFYYQPDLLPNYPYDPKTDWKSWTSWNREGANDLGRSYNYPHVVAAYWSLYRIARNTHGFVTRHPWDWYLNQADQTILAMQSQAPYYTQFGQMEGTVFVQVLEDMKSEGWKEKAAKLEAAMHERALVWKSKPYPFGSEMPWDSTGQEEVYDWTRYFGFTDKAEVTLNAILAYTPVLPSWGYNGSSRRYWDFLYGGKYERIERQLHHYGSGINAIPLLAEYRSHPDDLYLLRAGYAGMMGALNNIDQKGFASAAFHSFPDRMAYDPYTGDYGPNFFGHAINTGTYLVHDPQLGWLCFGGNLRQHGSTIHVDVLDSSRARLFIAPVSLWVTLDAGQITSADYDTRTNKVRLHLAPATGEVPQARLRFSASATHPWRLQSSTTEDAGAKVIPLNANETVIELETTH